MTKKRAQAATRWSILTCIMTASVTSWAQPLPPPPGPAPALPPAGSEQRPEVTGEGPSEPNAAESAWALPEAPESASALPEAPESASALPEAPESASAQPEAPESASALPEAAATEADRSGESSSERAPQITPRAQLEAELRRAWRRHHSSLRGSTGLLRTHAAATGRTGTFRFGLLGSYFGASGFLCPQCEARDGGPGYVEDEVSRAEAHVQISASIRPYLEAYFGLHSSATSNDRGDPELLQVLGDTTWGLKAFMPRVDDGLFTAGGAFELWLLNGSGGVGIGGASVALRGLASLDFSNRRDERARIPLRVHGNLSYVFDNSSELIEDTEAARRERITRIERFGLNINRVDRLVPAIGVEGLFEYVHPFVEWSIDIPSNIFKNYGCVRRTVKASDRCLTDHRSIAATPSRLTLGARAYGLLDGLSALLAFDVGMGGVSAPFWEETRPEPPWNLWFGLSYAVDTQPRVVVRTVREPIAPKAAPELYGVRARVVAAEGEAAPIAGAHVVFQGRDWNGFVTNARGWVQTPPLEAGSYTLEVEAEGYYANTCEVIVEPARQARAETSASSEALAPASPPAGGEGSDDDEESTPAFEVWPAPPGSASARMRWTSATCELSAKPQVGNLAGRVVDAASQDPVAGAQVSVIDALGRSLALLTNDNGAYRFENVIPGAVTIRVHAEDYLPTAVVVEMDSGQEIASNVSLAPVPDQPSFLVREHDVALEQPILFQEQRAELRADSLARVDELALLLKQRPDLAAVEIRVHASTDADLALSRERAARLRQALIDRGVQASRIEARGYEVTPERARPAGGADAQQVEIVRVER